MIIKYIVIGILMLGMVLPVNATTVDIYYPNNNTTTEFYYAVGGGFNTSTADTITGTFTCLIVKNEVEYINVIDAPHKMIAPIFSLIMVIILITFLLLAARLIKYVWRNQ